MAKEEILSISYNNLLDLLDAIQSDAICANGCKGALRYSPHIMIDTAIKSGIIERPLPVIVEKTVPHKVLFTFLVDKEIKKDISEIDYLEDIMTAKAIEDIARFIIKEKCYSLSKDKRKDGIEEWNYSVKICAPPKETK